MSLLADVFKIAVIDSDRFCKIGKIVQIANVPLWKKNIISQ